MSADTAGAARHVRVLELNSKAIRVVVAFVVLCLIAGWAFLAGERHGNRTTVLTGIAYTGMDVATVTVGGWSYGVSGNVTWFDSQGAEHDGSWPSCLRSIGRRVPITFGAVPVTAPGDSWRQIVWVDCRR
jgi:hypothetical protein